MRRLLVVPIISLLLAACSSGGAQPELGPQATATPSSAPETRSPGEASSPTPSSSPSASTSAEESGRVADPDATNEVPQEVLFAAVGDSYAAGTGAGVSRDCGRSDANWVGRLAGMYGADHVNLACAGATLPDAIEQAAALSDAVTHVGVSILGNDLGFIEAVARCAAGACTEAVSSALAALPGLRTQLEELLVLTADEGRKVLVMGYPRIFGGPCDFPIRSDDVGMLNGAIDTVNEFLAAAVQSVKDGRRSIDFVPSPDFAGHAVCDADSWVVGFDDPMMLHPNGQGHEMMALEALHTLPN